MVVFLENFRYPDARRGMIAVGAKRLCSACVWARVAPLAPRCVCVWGGGLAHQNFAFERQKNTEFLANHKNRKEVKRYLKGIIVCRGLFENGTGDNCSIM